MQSIHIAKSRLAPKFLMHRKYLLSLPLFLLIFVLAACGGKDFSPPAQPNLSLQAGEQSDGGLRTVACWPKGEKNVSCEFTSDANSPNPSTALTVQGGQAVNIVIANPEGVTLPKQVVITSRETDAAGAPLFTMQIDPTQSTEFVLALPNGRYLLDVTAYYPDIEGSSATVSNVFAVDVGEAIASNVTPEATAEITEIATEATTPEATAEITETPTAEVTAEITEEPTVAATEETGISGGNASETPAATEEIVEPTAESTEVVTEPAVTEEIASATPEATESATAVTPVATTPVATEEVVPTETATEVVTEVAAPPTATSTPTLPPPTPTNTATSTPTVTPTSTPTATPTLGISPTNTSVFDVDAPPAVTLRVTGRNYQPVGYDYCRRNATNELVCVKQPFTTTGSTSIRAARNAAANIRIDGDRPTSIEINYLSRDTLQPIATETRTGDKVVLFNFGVAAGSYVLSVEVAWPDVTVTYYFQIQVLQ
ncbi:MAG: hypothetical protein HY862_06735 [Chloroflexi bacterium]|nr:hypothetical protein [Chloroflexota bacterium]